MSVVLCILKKKTSITAIGPDNTLVQVGHADSFCNYSDYTRPQHFGKRNEMVKMVDMRIGTANRAFPKPPDYIIFGEPKEGITVYSNIQNNVTFLDSDTDNMPRVGTLKNVGKTWLIV